MEFDDFLQIYYDPRWQFEALCPTKFDVDMLYDATLMEMDYEEDPYLAMLFAMEELSDNRSPNYEFQSSFRRNPRDPKQMSLQQLQREERRLVEMIDDEKYFNRDPAQIAALESELLSLRRAMSTDNIHLSETVDQNSPEFAIQEHLNRVMAEMPVLQSLERVALDAFDYSKAQTYRIKKLGLQDTIEHVTPILKNLMSLRKIEAITIKQLGDISSKIAGANQTLSELIPRAGSAHVDEQLRLNREVDKITAELRKNELQQHGLSQDLNRTRQEISQDLSAIYRDFIKAGYPLEIRTHSVPMVVAPQLSIQTQPIATSNKEIPLPPEITAAFEILSNDPIVRGLQEKLKKAVNELVAAMEDREPRFVIKKIEARIAALHAEIEQRTRRYR